MKNNTLCAPSLFESVESPIHYENQKLQAIDVIEAYELGFCLGNVIKYTLRAGKKENKREDLQKAIWYLKREIASIKY